MTSTLRPALASETEKRPGRWLALSVLVLAVLLVAVDATVLGLATPYISEDLKPSGTQLLWIGDVYSFVIAGLLVSMGSLGDRIGRKKILLIGATAFGAISILNAYATTPELMILARALLGVAGATLMPATLALIRNLFHDPRERSLAVGIWGATASAGTAVGPVAGGFLLEHFWWGSVFLINLPVMAVLVLVGIKMLPESKNPNPGPWDLISVVLSLIGVIGVVYAVKEAATHGFELPSLAVGALGAAALYWFVRRQLASRAPVGHAPVPQPRLQRGSPGRPADHPRPVRPGLLPLPVPATGPGQGPVRGGPGRNPRRRRRGGGGLIAGRTARRYSVRAVVAGGLAAVGLSLAVLTTLNQSTGYPLLGAALLVVGVGAGFSFTVTADVILSSVPKEQAGAASAVSETAYELGAALGIAVLGSIVTGVYRGFAAPAGTPSGAHESLGGAVEAAAGMPSHASQEMLTSARDAFVSGLSVASAVGATVLLATAVAAWFMLRNQKLEDAG